MKTYITTKATIAWRKPGTVPMGWIRKDFEFTLSDSVPGYLAFKVANKLGKPINWWISASAAEPLTYAPPVEPPPPVFSDDIWWTKCFPSGIKPVGLKPEGINKGSFALVWLLPEEPEGFIYKPAGFNLSIFPIEAIRRFNPLNPGALKWLVDETGNKDILTVTPEGAYRCPVPCCSENNPVRVLELTDRFARIQTVSIYDPIPATLPPHLLHTWYGYTKGGVFYQVQGGLGGVKYPLLARSDSAWVDLRAIQKEKPT